MKTTKFLTLLCVITFAVTACKQRNEPYNPGSQSTNNSSISVTTSAITGIWKRTNFFSSDQMANEFHNENYATDAYEQFNSDGTYYQYSTRNPNSTDYNCKYGEWKVSDNLFQMRQLGVKSYYGSTNSLYEDNSDFFVGSWTKNKVYTLNNSTFKYSYLQYGYSGDGLTYEHILTFSKAYSLPSKYSVFSNSSGSGGGSTTQQGVTDLYLYDYTEWPTKIKVIYKYKSDVNVTSAKIYYGEYSASSSVSATVSSTTITATISGLKKNTVYYVKASATTSKGTVYSNESRISTAIE